MSHTFLQSKRMYQISNAHYHLCRTELRFTYCLYIVPWRQNDKAEICTMESWSWLPVLVHILITDVSCSQISGAFKKWFLLPYQSNIQKRLLVLQVQYYQLCTGLFLQGTKIYHVLSQLFWKSLLYKDTLWNSSGC